MAPLIKLGTSQLEEEGKRSISELVTSSTDTSLEENKAEGESLEADHPRERLSLFQSPVYNLTTFSPQSVGRFQVLLVSVGQSSLNF